MYIGTDLREKIVSLLTFSRDSLWIECVESLGREELHEVVWVLLDRIDELEGKFSNPKPSERA